VIPALALLATLAAPSNGGVTFYVIPMAPYGDSPGGSAGVPVPLTSSSFVAAAKGLDNLNTTADDLLLLVTGVGTGPEVTPIATPFLSDYSGAICRLAPNRVLLINGGATAAYNTADDGVYLVDDIGGANTVTNITVGFLNKQDGYTPVALDEKTAVLESRGPDGVIRTADDVIILLSNIGTSNTVTPLAAPYLTFQGRGRPVPLTANSFLVVSDGPDASDGTSDDLTYLFTNVGVTNTRTSFATGFLHQYAASTPVRLSPTRAVLGSLGPDGNEYTADDVLFLLDDLGGANSLTSINVPSISRYGSGVPVALSASSVMVSTGGADNAQRTTDDALVLVTDLGGANVKTSIVVGGIGDDRACRPVLLGPGTSAQVTAGADGNFSNADDEVVVLSGIGKTNTVHRIPLGGLDEGSVSRIVPLGPDSFLVANGGPDGIFGGGNDDRFTVVSGALGTAPTMVHTDSAGDLDSFYAAMQPQVLGNGLCVSVASGVNDSVTSGKDDLFQVINGVPTLRGLLTKTATLKFDTLNPAAGETISVKGRLGIVGENPFAGGAVILNVGGAKQTLDSRFITLKGTTYKYSDPKNLRGWVTKLSCNAKSGAFSLSGKGVATGAEDTDADGFTISVAGGDAALAEQLVGVASATGITYKAPKP
jgi:hypothetical protein